MPTRIVPYEDHHVPAVQRLNRRLSAGGCRYAFPESPVSAWLPPKDGARLFQEYFLALDGDEAHGGYILKHQDFVVGDDIMNIGNYQLPLSEGIIDGRYAAVGIQLLHDALHRRPLLYSLGIGSLSEPLARLLTAARWRIRAVPFYFYVCHARRFLRGLSYIRTSTFRRLALDTLASSGIGPLGIRLDQRLRRRKRGMPRRDLSAPFDRFGREFDLLWQHTRAGFSFSAVRSAAPLARLYLVHDRRFIKVKIEEDGELRGWAVLLATAMVDNKYFGNLRLGTIVDALCAPHYEAHLVSAAMQFLASQNVDLIISNQSYAPLGQALANRGFRSGPSNFLFAASPRLTALLDSIDRSLTAAHLNRGDGDGPIHL